MLRLKNSHDLAAYFDIPAEALAFIESLSAATPLGRYEFGDKCYVMVMECDTTAGRGRVETHRKYVDVQYLLDGEEAMCVTPASPALAEETPYNAEKDIAFFHYTEATYFVCRTGEGVVFYPADAHRPCLAPAAPMKIKKAVVKLAVELARA